MPMPRPAQMTRRRQTVLLVAVGLLAVLPLAAAAADDKDKKPAEPPPLDARETTAAYLDAALNGRVDEATALGDPDTGPGRPESVKDFAELKIKKLALKSVQADDTGALAITEDVKGDHDRVGPLVLTLVKKKGRWLVRDIDLEDDEKG